LLAKARIELSIKNYLQCNALTRGSPAIFFEGS
jgi:hypothetical protein